ncbi:1-acyl-sn-glycerol-3-phosphate acyltransferase [Streptomyces sp. 3330]|uniref:lysophospholipid acyltransferase family protein n=1 Tax=Streptomyces sp. 3330 TaxID=2817755 RepID=UPI002865147D|nr:lysophospholipid acyltransferase family protein [Streptomyces sp. 3330]MDR6978010.1 1-acyl-sn-glycerol-3-phosphate acyltransferase [Streptomyces sp. 3330]
MSAWLPGAPCTPRACVQATATLTAVPRAVLRLAAVAVLVLAGVALAPVGGWFPSRVVRCWSRTVVRAAGVRVRATGATPPADGGLLLVANHISWLDIPLLAAVRPARMLAKDEIRRWPVAGTLVARGGVLFIDRDRLRALPGTVAAIADALRAGRAVAVFPEGSTWCGRAQGHFRRAVFQAALDARAPVQPVRIRYRDRAGAPSTVAAFVGDDPLLASLWRVVSARGLVAEVEVLPALAPDGHPDRRALAAAAGALVLHGTPERRVMPRPGRAGTLPVPACRRPDPREPGPSHGGVRGPGETLRRAGETPEALPRSRVPSTHLDGIMTHPDPRRERA